MFGISLDPETSERLSRLAQEAGQSEVDFAGAALREYLLELDDAALAQSRLQEAAPTYSAAQVKRELGL